MDTHLWNVFAVLTAFASLEETGVLGASQETMYITDCIRSMVPMQVFSECCLRENNCTITRQQNRAIDCISRLMMANATWIESARDTSSEEASSYSRSRSRGEIGAAISELCRRQPRTRLQTCIRNDLIKRCRYGLMEDRETRQSTRYYGSRTRDYGSRFGDYGTSGSRLGDYGRQDYGRRWRRGPIRREEVVVVRGPTELVAEPWYNDRDSFENEEEEDEVYPESSETRYIK